MKKMWWLLLLIPVIVVGGYLISNSGKGKQVMPGEMQEEMEQVSPTPVGEIQPTQVIDIRANFEIYTRGTKRIFTAAMYHNLSPNVFISAESPGQVQVKTAGVTWGDFFATLPMKLTKECLTTGTGQNFCSNQTEKLIFMINGVENPEALGEVIGQGDGLLVRYE